MFCCTARQIMHQIPSITFGIETTMPLREIYFRKQSPEDKILQGGILPVLKHQALISGGGLNTIRAGSDVDILTICIQTERKE